MDKPEVHLLHGFNVRDQGLRTVGQVRDEFEEVGYTVRALTYGYFFRARVRLCTRGVAKMLACLAPLGKAASEWVTDRATHALPYTVTVHRTSDGRQHVTVQDCDGRIVRRG